MWCDVQNMRFIIFIFIYIPCLNKHDLGNCVDYCDGIIVI